MSIKLKFSKKGNLNWPWGYFRVGDGKVPSERNVKESSLEAEQLFCFIRSPAKFVIQFTSL